ncbi:glycerophosphodiester phosphodiesterase [Cesiribacter sp. SM1]|uniref:glycerophosphodiester phosphodiesterase n=1 Tax=Cesiribacter sp. SM1 TaxID=2861196 RepID=UPI001CD3503F|nr:glycerophosphodiester phosphodiesterase [Cesiribacter sp. SM1]
MKRKSHLFAVMFTANLLLSMTLQAQEIIAHRGASYLAPENTLASVKQGYEQGAEAVEIDIHLSQDNQLMVIHDKDTRRTAGGKNLLIKDTPSEELRKLEVGSWKDQKYKGEKIPLLQEVLALVPADKKLVIEIKTGPEALPRLQQVVAESGIRDRLIFISFSKDAIVQAKQQMPEVPAYWLLHNYKDYSLEQATQIAKESKLNGLDVHYKLVDKGFMQKMQEQGLETYVYTVNDPKAAKELAVLGVKGITTDRPGWLREQMDRSAQQ